MEVPGSPASKATEHDVSDVVDEQRIDSNDWILAVVLLTFFLFLKHRFPFAERGTCCAFLMAILAPRETRRNAFLVHFGEVLLARHVDTTAALQDEVALTNFRDEMFPAIPGSDAGFVVCERAALAVDEGA
jgi:hypothetical protein